MENAVSSTLNVMDDIVLKVYHEVPRPARLFLEKINTNALSHDTDGADSDQLTHNCFFLKGNLKDILSSLTEDMFVIAVELPSANPAAVCKVLEEIIKKCPNVRALKIGRNGKSPGKLNKKTEKALVKVFKKIATSCTELSHLEIRDVVITRPVYDILSEMSHLAALGANVAWDDLESKLCADRLITKLEMQPKIELFDFKQYGKFRGPMEHTTRDFIKTKLKAVEGLSVTTRTNKLDWLFQCEALRYLDLDISAPELLSKTKSQATWACLENLHKLKLCSNTLTGIPPLKQCVHLTDVILDIKTPDEDFSTWADERMPPHLEFAMFTKVSKCKMDMLYAFQNHEELKALYFGYLENGLPAIGTSAAPSSLSFLVILENNDPENDSEFYDAAAAQIQSDLPGLRFKVNGFESPLSTVLWTSYCKKMRRLIENPVVFDWAVPCFSDKLYSKSDACGTGYEECPCVLGKK
ncbi:unnamed protein product [Notodromas monacha]|uniref:Uncharacterized protein n=1 Tax=Notodromas monacha TaxID=399045 RepID=A0A7R9BUE8_9CRUS|nr:unnamed protein product [Notodromas monacha]CAG0921954.1 unnamed protein product [Notodromas monacha]